MKKKYWVKSLSIAVAVIMVLGLATVFASASNQYPSENSDKAGAEVRIHITYPPVGTYIFVALENQYKNEYGGLIWVKYSDWAGPYYVDGKKVSRKKFMKAMNAFFYFDQGYLRVDAAKEKYGKNYKKKFASLGFNMKKKKHYLGVTYVFKGVGKGKNTLIIENNKFPRTVKVKSFNKTYKMKKIKLKRIVFVK
jgi:hypothetical protein